MQEQIRYSANIKQNNNLVASYYSNDLRSIKNTIFSIIEDATKETHADIFDNELSKEVFRILKYDDAA